jgi:hypothetical protein
MTLSKAQLEELKSIYCEQIIEGMDMDTLVQCCHDLLMDAYNDATEEEIRDEILDIYDEEYLESLLESVEKSDGV